MKKSDDPLPRLFRAAISAPDEGTPPPASDLENRVMAQWRNGGTEDQTAMLVHLLRSAVLFASCIMVLSLGWSWVQSSNENATETALTSYAINVQLPP